MAKGATVRGTPYHFQGTGATRMQGVAPSDARKPSEMSGVVNRQFEGDQSRKVNPRSGTEYQSEVGNSDEFIREASHGPKGGVVLSENGINMNEPRSNGNGVILDGITRESAYSARAAGAMDSPVPKGAPSFAGADMVAENRAHLGRGNERAASDVITEIGGVMSRGMIGTSTPSGGPDELLEDDVLRNLGPGGTVG